MDNTSPLRQVCSGSWQSQAFVPRSWGLLLAAGVGLQLPGLGGSPGEELVALPVLLCHLAGHQPCWGRGHRLSPLQNTQGKPHFTHPHLSFCSLCPTALSGPPARGRGHRIRSLQDQDAPSPALPSRVTCMPPGGPGKEEKRPRPYCLATSRHNLESNTRVWASCVSVGPSCRGWGTLGTAAAPTQGKEQARQGEEAGWTSQMGQEAAHLGPVGQVGSCDSL